MGEVWKAHDARLDRIVAVKMPLRGALGLSATTPAASDSGVRPTLSRLSHAGIATVFDFHSEQDQEFLVMEFVPGGTLSPGCERVRCRLGRSNRSAPRSPTRWRTRTVTASFIAI